MSLELVRNYIKLGLYQEARRLIERENVDVLMGRREKCRGNSEQLPLLVLLSLIKDEENAANLSRLLLEKGYRLNVCDANGLCAINYALALRKKQLVNLYLDAFNFELDSYRDAYANTLLHYVYAANCRDLIERFRLVYTKYYEWNVEKFRHMINCDGLSVRHLHDYINFLNDMRNSNKNVNLILPDAFNYDSSPIRICKYINKIYNSNSTIKAELMFVQNSARDRPSSSSTYLSTSSNKNNNSSSKNLDFKLNILYQLREINKADKIKQTNAPSVLSKSLHELKTLPVVVTENRVQGELHSSPINYEDHRPRMGLVKTSDDYSENGPDELTKRPNWRADFRRLYKEFSIINSASYRPSTAIIMRSKPSSNSQMSSNLNESLGSFNVGGPLDGKIPTISVDSPSIHHKAGNAAGAGASISTTHSQSSDSKSKQGKLDIYLRPGSVYRGKKH